MLLHIITLMADSSRYLNQFLIESIAVRYVVEKLNTYCTKRSIKHVNYLNIK